MQAHERRSTSSRRVAVSTLVEMCGLDAGTDSAFEAESVNVSGRGMQVRTAYLPEVGTPLVCRLEHQGREIIVEGSVAWRRDEPGGGEFGLKFTAVDSGSVDTLKLLCGLELPEDDAPEPPSPEPDLPSPPPPNLSGSRVKLHIEGLGSPMRARVREGGTRRVYVGSNLEFLAMGKQLELENLDHELRRPARIDAVEVVIDPQTQIPQLVVALHYDDVDDTPGPSVVDTAEPQAPVTPADSLGVDLGAPGELPALERAEAGTDDGPGLVEQALDDGEPDPDDALQVTPLPTKLGRLASSAARGAGGQVSRFGATATSNVRRAVQTALQGAGSKVRELHEKRAAGKAPRRVTAEHPDGPLSVQGARLRPQSAPAPTLRRQGAPPGKTEAVKKKRSVPARKLMIGGAALALFGTVGVIALAGTKPPPGAEQGPQPSAVEVSVNDDVTEVDDEGNPLPKMAEVTRLEQPKAAGTGVVADVPLFGPTPLATMEPAPLGPTPGAGDDPATSKAKAADETFEKEPVERRRKAKPRKVKPWGSGRMHLPVIHRLRLDSPGAAIEGARHPTGFSVVIPDRKVMEGGKSIAKRDKRIARVKARNTSSGAQITFKFRGGVPGYRVRLRKDFVEILLSSPKE